MPRFPSLSGWHHDHACRRLVAGIGLVWVSSGVLTAQSLPPAGAPEIKPTTAPGAELKNQLIIGAGAAASGPQGARVIMRVEYAPYGRQFFLVGFSAEEQVGNTAVMLMGMPVSYRIGRTRLWVAPLAAFDDEPSWVGSGGVAREFTFGENDIVASTSLNRIRDTWQWSLHFSFVNQKW